MLATRPCARQGERMAINMPIQGTAADIIKIAMIRLDERLREGGFRARPLLQVHDELLLEVPRDEVDRLVPVLRQTMESALALDVPLTVDVKVGDDWEGDGRPAARGTDPGRCLSCPRSRPSSGTSGRGSSAHEISSARSSWSRTLRTHPPEAFEAAIRGRRIESVERRAKLLVIELSGGAALTIHLKMTGQLFVVPGEHARGPLPAPGPRLRRRARAALSRHSQVRPGGPVRTRPGQRRARQRGGRHGRVRGLRPRAARPGVRTARVPASASGLARVG